MKDCTLCNRPRDPECDICNGISERPKSELVKTLTIPGIHGEHKTNQLKFLFPMSASVNQELLETLKKEYSQGGLSEAEAILLQRSIQDEKNRPIYYEK